MRLHLSVDMVLAMTIAVWSGSAFAQPVFVRAQRDAQGIARPTAAGCFVVTVNHALADSLDPVRIVAASGLNATASVERRYAPDVVVLRVSENANRICVEPWPNRRPWTPVLPAGPMEIRHVDVNGGMHVVPVTVTYAEGRTLHVRPDPSDHVPQGFSGSPLFVRGELFGMVSSETSRRDVVIHTLADLSDILGTDLPPPSNLSGSWRLMRDGPVGPLDPSGTIVQLVHSGEVIEVRVEMPGDELQKHREWAVGTLVWKGVLPTTGAPSVRGYPRPVIAEHLERRIPADAAARLTTAAVPFVLDADARRIRTQFVFAEAEWNQSNGTASLPSRTVSVTLRRTDELVDNPIPERAFRQLREIFRTVGYYQTEQAKTVHPALRFHTAVRSLTDCRLTLDETLEGGASLDRLNEAIHEITTIDLANLDLDQITVVQGLLDVFPRDAWFVRVAAHGPALQVHLTRVLAGASEEPRPNQPDQVLFFARFEQSARGIATALTTLARSCGSR